MSRKRNMKLKFFVLLSIVVVTLIVGFVTVINLPTNVVAKKAYINNVNFAKLKTLTEEEKFAYALLEQLGETNVSIVFTSDPSLNCGAEKSRTQTGGCYRHSTPNKIYISSGVSEDILKYLIYHEYAHLIQHRNNLEGGECAADKQALEWGANLVYSSYSECKLVEQYGIIKNLSKKSLSKTGVDQ